MACACKKNREARVQVQLPGGLKITKPNQAAAEEYVRGHPGSKMVVKAA